MKLIHKLSRRIIKNKYFQRYIAWQGQQVPFNGWHSWDPHPWKHPWLTKENLTVMRNYSKEFREKIRHATQNYDAKDFHFGFCGNTANNLYVRAKSLRRANLNITIYIHPQDHCIMGHPTWEEFDGTVVGSETNINKLRETTHLPTVSDVEYGHEESQQINFSFYRQHNYMKFSHLLRYPYYGRCLASALKSMRKMDALLCSQSIYFGYLSQRPYIATQVGSDTWFESSRGDELGILQRESFSKAKAFLVSNPWSYAHARRLGFNHLVYLPMMLDETVYSPGYGESRAEWVAKSGGSFFVLTTSRLDEIYKGSSIGLNGIVEFIRYVPEARLVLVGWGTNKLEQQKRLEALGIADKVVWLPMSGKAKVRDYLRSADCFVDQFVVGYFGGAGLESMASGIPVIGRIEAEQYAGLCETGAPPILNADTAEKVTGYLRMLFNNPIRRIELGNMSRQWFIDNHSSKRWNADYQALLIATALKLPFDFSSSLLNVPLTAIEDEYHRAGLASAPIFPNYL